MPKLLPTTPSPLPRRSFLNSLATGVIGTLAVPTVRLARQKNTVRSKQVIVGKVNHVYEWISDWMKLPEGMSLGSCHGGIVLDSHGRIIFNTETERAVMIFAPDGKYIKSWGKEFQAGCHGMMIRKEGNSEYLYLTHTGRHEVIKVTLDGEVVWTRGYPETAGIYQAAADYKPTAVAFAPNGDFYVTDGYGKYWVHQYNAKAEYVKSWGGPGNEPGKLNNPHGIWVDTRRKVPVVVVADRGNKRLQIFSLEGNHIGFVTQEMRLPSNMDQRGDDLVIADLAGKVTILDKNNQVITHLGDNTDPKRRGTNQIPANEWVDGIFISPHCPRWDKQGNLYIHEWLTSGRVVKLKRI